MKLLLSAVLFTSAAAKSLRGEDGGERRLVLGPGYEDDIWCPPGYCHRDVFLGEGIAGPKSTFAECYNPVTNKVIDEVWTGDKTDVEVPNGWVTPEPCDDVIKPLPVISERGITKCLKAVARADFTTGYVDLYETIEPRAGYDLSDYLYRLDPSCDFHDFCAFVDEVDVGKIQEVSKEEDVPEEGVRDEDNEAMAAMPPGNTASWFLDDLEKLGCGAPNYCPRNGNGPGSFCNSGMFNINCCPSAITIRANTGKPSNAFDGYTHTKWNSGDNKGAIRAIWKDNVAIDAVTLIPEFTSGTGSRSGRGNYKIFARDMYGNDFEVRSYTGFVTTGKPLRLRLSGAPVYTKELLIKCIDGHDSWCSFQEIQVDGSC